MIKHKANQKSNLYDAFALLKTPKEFESFIKDLCTPNEIKSFFERWEVCQHLDDGTLSYREISEITGASTTTISRVSRFLNHEPHHGYRLLLDRLTKTAAE